MAKKITEIEAELQEWEFLKQLPKELEGFTLREGTGIKGNILNIASYVDEVNHICVDLIYTGETFDYVIAYVSTVMTLSRNAVLIGTVIFAACCITCCFFGKKKREFRLITLTLIVIFAVFALIFHEKILEILDHYVRKGLDDSGRFTIWKESFDAFLGNVLVGGGFHGFDASYSSVAMFMPELPHNTPLALLGGGGLLMFGSYCVHRFYTLCPFIKRPTLEKTLLLLAVLTLIGESLLDNFFFNFYPTFAYTAAICVVLRAEKTE